MASASLLLLLLLLLLLPPLHGALHCVAVGGEGAVLVVTAPVGCRAVGREQAAWVWRKGGEGGWPRASGYGVRVNGGGRYEERGASGSG